MLISKKLINLKIKYTPLTSLFKTLDNYTYIGTLPNCVFTPPVVPFCFMVGIYVSVEKHPLRNVQNPLLDL